ncbi:hypothetical protein K432DRAFT_287974 [Lepidopterella palustris CBS 459.81]|uniref:Uncharacterized protein n=1 Tax=Lepidopterella palustris CBS 459.81 TaxID=1314670 RepID=A0A8E2EJ07_9PEZI|nr:hypothetical protein K432DRAFT_287974 [Lepidopterella palustris CBS 459.81]
MDLRFDPEFPVRHILDGLKCRERMNRIVISANRKKHLPTPFQGLTIDRLYQVRVELVHRIAYQFSLDRTLSARQCHRHVYYLYKYLHRYQQPIGVLMTKALVQTAIIRPLLENRFVSTRRFCWLRDLIARVEGQDVAEKLDKLFWDWRGEVIRKSQSHLYEADGIGLAHVNTMKRLGLLEKVSPGLRP